MLCHELEKETKKTATKDKMTNFMRHLLQATENNSEKPKWKRNYGLKWKQFAAYMYQIAGRKFYTLLVLNAPGGFPCISTLKRTISDSNEIPKEGEIRFDLVAAYLEKRGYPKAICIGEDGTRVVSKVQYDSATNQLVGLLPKLDEHGLPVFGSFPATSAQVIKQHLEENLLSNYAYCLMAQPLVDGAAPICLALFGTNNAFTTLDVSRREKYLQQEALKHGVTIFVLSSDGDTRLMKFMQGYSFSSSCDTFGKWFKSDTFKNTVCVQDHIHIATKLRNRLLKSSILLPVGSYLVSPADVRVLIKTLSKDQHNLSESDINSKDRMNYRSIEKMMERNVCQLLKKTVPGSLGTAAYLKMTRQVVAAYMDKFLSPTERIIYIWRWIFFLRLWRSWLIKNDYSVQDNFITSNSYYCIEINAHSLIIAIIIFRRLSKDDLFLPWLFSSQCCEGFFRLARLMTSTLTTVVNFTVLELLQRIRRIDFQADVEATLGDTFNFTSSHRSSKTKQQVAPKFTMPSDDEIKNAVSQAEALALKTAHKLGLDENSVPEPSFSFDSFPEEENLDDDCSLVDMDVDGDISAEEDSAEHEELAGISEDLCMVSTGVLGVKTFEDVNLSPSSIYVKVADGLNQPVIIKKITLLYILNRVGTKLSSDRLLRVEMPEVTRLSTPHAVLESVMKAESINQDDWCAFSTADRKTFLIGRTVAFGYMSGKTNKELQYSRSFATVESDKTGKSVGVLCVWYSLKGNQLHPDISFSHGYHDISFYLCTIPRPQHSNSSLYLNKKTCSDIRTMFRSFSHKKSKK